MVIATCKDNIPRATVLDFFNEGLTIWLAGEAGGKIANIRANPNIAGVIYTPIDHSVDNESLQIWGKATLITRKSDPEEYERRMKMWNLRRAMLFLIKPSLEAQGIPQDKWERACYLRAETITFVKIEPTRIKYVLFKTDGTGIVHIWAKDYIKSFKVPPKIDEKKLDVEKIPAIEEIEWFSSDRE